MSSNTIKIRSTTIVAVRRNGFAAMAGDGQVSLEASIVKTSARKVRKIYHDQILCGFAGSTADALALLERFEEKLEEYSGNLQRSAVELAKQWRMDRALRRLEALMLVANKDHIFLISGTGDVIEPDEPVASVGSGGGYALASARSLLKHTDLDAETIAKEAILSASEICVYTNDSLTIETLNPS